MQLIVPMSGQGRRYLEAGYSQPKPLVPVNGTPMIERVLSMYPADWPATFVIADTHAGGALPGVLRRLRPDGRQVSIPAHDHGPGVALEAALDHLDPDAEVFVSYCDFGMVFDARHFERFVADTACDACAISYRGFHAHYLSPTTYAYSRMEGERVVEVREKGSFTSNREAEYAQAGAFYFKSARLLRDSIAAQKKLGLAHNGEFYTSLTIEALLRTQPSSHVRVYEVPAFFQWGTPADLRAFEYWESTYRAYNRAAGASRPRVGQVLMPMAGGGARFRDVTPLPKPLIPIDGQPMFIRALESLPVANRTVIVTLRSIATQPPLTDGTRAVVALEATPAGQALSVEAGLDALDPAGDIVISSCDHAVVLDPRHIAALQREGADAAVFTMTGYPGAERRPAAYAYVVPGPADGSAFPRVARVSVKVPLSNTPSRDPVLVGTFWFLNRDVLAKGLAALTAANATVNGELYLDAIVEILARAGYTVRMVPLDGYIGWGDPDAMAEALYWRDVFTGHAIARRSRLPGVTP